MKRFIGDIEAVASAASDVFAAKNAAREKSLGACREAIRNSANAIRAVHRGEFDVAETLAAKAGSLVAEAKAATRDHQDIYHAGFVHDAAKEYAEARTTLALISGRGDFPTPQSLDIETAAYLNGLAEAVGELRRYLLDKLRLGDVDRCEEVLSVMDEVYGILVTFDYPDAMTGGLRRTTDNVRGILERTRGDLALSVRQRQLEDKLSEFEKRLGA
jgi:translin